MTCPTTRRVLCATALLVGACGPTIPRVQVGPPKSHPHVAGKLFVGTGRADITVPPGAATFGHGPDARYADGFWTRTYCRVFFIRSEHGQKLAIVPCEMASMSALLQRSVAERVERAKLLHASQLMMTAVHTHAGVAHYFGSSQYTDIFSTRLPAYDHELVQVLADRIAAAIRVAHDDARPARVGWAHHEDFWCFTRNRSLEAYRLNLRPFQRNPPADLACDVAGRADLRAVDPDLHVLRFDAIDPADTTATLGPIGSISMFAMHPTIIRSTNRLFGGDTTGMVNRHVERELRREWVRNRPALLACADDPKAAGCPVDLPDPLHGVISTNLGDVSPIWSRGNIEEAVAFGQRLGSFVWSRHPPAGSGASQAVLDSRYFEESIRGARFHDRDGTTHRTCGYPQVGQGAARGGSDHPTSVATLAVFEQDAPTDFDSDSCQAPKVPLLGWLSELVKPKGAFPSELPLAVARIDDTLLAFLPAELTITAGHRITDRVVQAVAHYPGAPKRAVIAGLANAYIQYATTKEEYQLQRYEGASTLFGDETAGYFANRAALLARSMFDPGVNQHLRHLGEARTMTFKFGPSHERYAQRENDGVGRTHMRTCTMPGSLEPPRLCTYWQDGPPGDVALGRAPWVRLVGGAAEGAQTSVRLCHERAGFCDLAGYVDDRGHEFRTRIHDEVGDGWIWSTLFSPDAGTWKQLEGLRLRLRIEGEAPVESPAFSTRSLPRRCSLKQARLCLEAERTDDWSDLPGVEGR